MYTIICIVFDKILLKLSTFKMIFQTFQINVKKEWRKKRKFLLKKLEQLFFL